MVSRRGMIPIVDHPLQKCEKIGPSISRISEKFYAECDRDGNCLYTSILWCIFPLFDNCEFKSRFLSFPQHFEEAGVSPVVYETYIEEIEEFINKKYCVDDLDPQNVLIFVGYLRLICSTTILLNEEKYKDFIEGDLKKHCAHFIDPMGMRGGTLEAEALADALGVKITLVAVIETPPFRASFGHGIEIKILHTPDHFEPLY